MRSSRENSPRISSHAHYHCVSDTEAAAALKGLYGSRPRRAADTQGLDSYSLRYHEQDPHISGKRQTRHFYRNARNKQLSGLRMSGNVLQITSDITARDVPSPHRRCPDMARPLRHCAARSQVSPGLPDSDSRADIHIRPCTGHRVWRDTHGGSCRPCPRAHRAHPHTMTVEDRRQRTWAPKHARH